MISLSALIVSSLPNLPNLSTKVGKCEALQRKGFPNLPNLPNLRRVCTRPHTPAPPRVHAGTTHVIGWEGWEGWEEAVIERFGCSQPQNTGWEGWEQTLGNGGLSCQ